jgi:uncharacterized protein
MLVLLSPAKTLDYESDIPPYPVRLPSFLEDSAKLIEGLRMLNSSEIAQLMKVSEKIALLNEDRFSEWTIEFNASNSRPALFAFKGDVYTGLNALSLNSDQLEWADNHLRHLSGLYGLLKPLDFMFPYRLEMGTRFQNDRGNNLYQFWGTRLTDLINQEIADSHCKALIQLASNEYSQAVQLKHIDCPVITPIFKDTKNGQLKVISFYAKKARGMMARYIIEKKIVTPGKLKYFDIDGYQYDDALSTEFEWVYTRGEF